MPESRDNSQQSRGADPVLLRDSEWYAHPERWRARLLTLLLRTAAVLGSIVAVPSIYISIVVEQPGIALLDSLAVAVVLGLLYFKLPYRVRAVAFSLVTYALGAGLLASVGPISQVYLLGYSLLTTLLLGMGAGAVSVALNAATLLLIGGTGYAADMMMPERWGADFIAWVVVTLNFLLINALLMLSLGMVIAALEKALALERESHDALEHERSELLRANQALHVEVAERARAEAALQESETRFRELAENVRDVFYNFDPVNERVLYVSPAYETIWGRPLEGVYAHYEDFMSGVHPEDREAVLAATMRQLTGESTTIEGRVLRPDGEVRWVRDHAYPVFDEQGTVRRLVGTVQDITERKLAEQDREALESRLRESQKLEAVGRLAGGIAHDFNNMLTVILGNASVALDSIDAEDPLRESLEPIIKAGERSAELTSQLLAYARRQTIEPKVLDIDRVVAGTMSMLGRLAGQEISLLWKPSLGLKQIKMDPAQIDKMLANLILNARDAIGGMGCITIETDTAEVAADTPDRNAGSYVVLRVTDDGCGMDEATAAQVFEPFFTTKPQGQGTGLGLAMVHGIVNQNGGFLELQSAPGQGTSFKLYFPRYRVESTPSTTPAAEEPERLQGSETILLLEEEPTLLDLAARTLERRGYVVMSAENPATALRFAEQAPKPIDLLISDATLPGTSIHDLLCQLRRHCPGIRCVLMSGYPVEESAHNGAAVLLKPFTVRALAERVRDTLDAPLPEV